MRTYKGLLTELPANGIFLYGANYEGIHGAGAALAARRHFGAEYGKVGLVGRSWGVVTKDLKADKHPSVSMRDIMNQIEDAYRWAKDFPDVDIYVAYSGDGYNLNGYTNEDMAFMFGSLQPPENIIFEEGFAKLVQNAALS